MPKLKSKPRYSFYRNCVGWDDADVDATGGLSDMVDAAERITRRTFLRHVDRASLAEVERSLSYAAHPSAGLTMAGDWHVGYFRSYLHGNRVYGFVHSLIEYVFTAR